jgi:hypothetical protein
MRKQRRRHCSGRSRLWEWNCPWSCRSQVDRSRCVPRPAGPRPPGAVGAGPRVWPVGARDRNQQAVAAPRLRERHFHAPGLKRGDMCVQRLKAQWVVLKIYGVARRSGRGLSRPLSPTTTTRAITWRWAMSHRLMCSTGGGS